MKNILEKHYRAVAGDELEDLTHLCKIISSETKITVRLPNLFRYLFSLLLDKLQALFPSSSIFVSKMIDSNVSFKGFKIKEDKKTEYSAKSTTLDSGIELNFVDLINDVRLLQNICSSWGKEELIDNSSATDLSNYAHEYIRRLIRRKVPM